MESETLIEVAGLSVVRVARQDSGESFAAGTGKGMLQQSSAQSQPPAFGQHCH